MIPQNDPPISEPGSGSIYERPHAPEEAQGHEEVYDLLEDALRSRRRQRMVFSLLFSLALGGLAAVVYLNREEDSKSEPYRFPDIRRPAAAVAPATSSSNAEFVVHRDATYIKSRSARFLLDELRQIEADTPPPEGPVDFNTTWIKQASYHLVEADRLYAEKRLESALEHYLIAQRMFPELQGLQRSLGLTLLQLKEYEKALPALKAALTEEPENHGLLNNLGAAHLAMEALEEAEACFRKSMEKAPRYLPARYNLAALLTRCERHSEAQPLYQALLKDQPNHAEAARMYVRSLCATESWEAAARELEKLIVAGHNSPPMQVKLAEVRAQLGQKDAAIKCLREAIRDTGPTTALGWLARKEFNALRETPEFTALIEELSGSRTP